VTRRREVFYWFAVIFTFAMGTAVGDLFAHTLNLGYLASAFLFTALIFVPLAAWRMGANPVLTFWVAYVLTRPIGASFADYFGMPKDLSGLGVGHGAVSVVTLIACAASFTYLSRTGIDQPEPVTLPATAGQPGYGQPGYVQPGHGDARYGQAGYGQAGYGPGGYDQTGNRPGGYGPSGSDQPGYGPYRR
jgi:hypothetical protein